jgi:hypothetical protein
MRQNREQIINKREHRAGKSEQKRLLTLVA